MLSTIEKSESPESLDQLLRRHPGLEGSDGAMQGRIFRASRVVIVPFLEEGFPDPFPGFARESSRKWYISVAAAVLQREALAHTPVAQRDDVCENVHRRLVERKSFANVEEGEVHDVAHRYAVALEQGGHDARERPVEHGAHPLGDLFALGSQSPPTFGR
ncbi:hypothetical protein NUW54_g8342 [Trametes sanguinea]|uniref:Uncharacterized protein n=1 Tax=Trametes sanguinea TaxID=158606 RepID=A0ACC1PFH9_9APHY|nr:hypothetical protein NUW54_g8342 [Trametes sanguinea]